MTDSCSSCFFLRTDSGGLHRCCCNAPSRVLFGSDPSTTWPPVAPDAWCGDGADAATGRPFGTTWHDVVTAANLPTNQPAGTKLFVSDSQNKNFGTSVNGGGSNLVPVYTDGLNNWFIG